MRLKLASRQSDLARWQAVRVGRALEGLQEKPNIEFIFKVSKGDLDQDAELSAMGAKGVFTEDLHQDLVSGACDLVVHSWKDLPIEEHADTRIAMTLPRADVRDILLIPETVWQEAVNTGRLEILTSSPRRVYNLQAGLAELLPAKLRLSFLSVRGNVPTRLMKMREQKRGLVLAKAGLDRLLIAEDEGFLKDGLSIRALLEGCRFMVLPIRVNPAAPAQGALAVEISASNSPLSELCARLNHEATWQAARHEREILARYGGGCHQKIGVTILHLPAGRLVSLRGLTESGEVLDAWKLESSTPWAPARSENEIFPREMKESRWFRREALSHAPLEAAEAQALYVSRGEALTFAPRPYQVLWTAGLRTWRQLAQRGIWVHGSSEGLGEVEGVNLKALLGDLSWTKLSHTRAPNANGMNSVATYELLPLKEMPDLRGKTHFFWTSTTALERALTAFPNEIRAGYNAAGPGRTFEALGRVAGLKHPPKAFVDLNQFLMESWPSKR